LGLGFLGRHIGLPLLEGATTPAFSGQICGGKVVEIGGGWCYNTGCGFERLFVQMQ